MRGILIILQMLLFCVGKEDRKETDSRWFRRWEKGDGNNSQKQNSKKQKKEDQENSGRKMQKSNTVSIIQVPHTLVPDTPFQEQKQT